MKISIINKINRFFIYVMIFSIISIFINMTISYALINTYNQIVKNGEHTRNLVSLVQRDIPNETWKIVCGMNDFEDGKQDEMIEEIKDGIEYLKENSIDTKRTELELALRTMITLNAYIQELGLQVAAESSIDDLIATNEEIKSVAVVVGEMLEEYNNAETASVAELNRRITLIQSFLLFLDIVIISAFLYFMIRNLKKLTMAIRKPLSSLESMSGKIADGDFGIRVKDMEVYELKALTNSLNVMAGKIEELIEENNIKHENLKKAEMNLLQAQIKPHFLYNTYDTIIWLAEQRKVKDAIKVVQALTTFYRTSLSKGKDWVTIEEEINHVESYLLIQQFRYGRLLHYTINCEDDLKQLYILKLLLQPLVENSIYHGIKYLREPGNITINATREGDYIVVEVKDDGIGIAQAQLKTLLAQMKDDKIYTKEDTSFGILNVYKRIKLYYGEDSNMIIESKENEGTRIVLKLNSNASKGRQTGIKK